MQAVLLTNSLAVAQNHTMASDSNCWSVFNQWVICHKSLQTVDRHWPNAGHHCWTHLLYIR